MSNLIDTMAKDMRIYPYQGESREKYYCRLAYSATAHWFRYLTQDNNIDSHYKSKQYILSRGKEILYAISESIPEYQTWIYQEGIESIEDAVRIIRENMLLTGELVEVNDNSRITIPEYKKTPCGMSLKRIVGISENKDICEFVGLTRIQNSNEDNENKEKIVLSDFLNWIYKTAKWNICGNINDYEIFDVTSIKAPYQSWSDRKNKAISDHLGRLSLFNGMHEYWLLKYDDGEWYSAPLSPILTELKEERRIILALRQRHNNPMRASYIYRNQVILLTMYCRLPLREERYLTTYCWPANYLTDKLNYIVPFKMWDQVSELLSNELGIILKEKF
ncbi:hypothetical protein [Butyrivibrio sp. INlla16]|uniref:hypothetical protein n=1 Tax=Butyrivibrio sp. INlla16 TaxID=1520807 RepID=UPI000884FBF1|nr:hypothetical protein [Butyrivibrio sp. INlla16]SDB53956.1 hypothetical protein SAMN02910263_02729 [Butyrivibrio sp. INlla16]